MSYLSSLIVFISAFGVALASSWLWLPVIVVATIVHVGVLARFYFGRRK